MDIDNTALNPAVVIPAHGKADDALDRSSVSHTKEYIQFYEEALKNNKTSEALINAIKAKYPAI